MAEGKILPYLDIPFQHASPPVLKNMRRPAHQEKTLERIRRWREICPDLAIRSTFIVGFPGETEEDFEMLLDWLDEAKIDRVGCFKYEPVKGAAANELGRRRCRRRSRRRAGTASCSASRRSAPSCCKRRSASACRSSSTRPDATVGQGPLEIRRAGDRRHRPHCLAPPAARRRHRHGQDRPRRRLRPARRWRSPRPPRWRRARIASRRLRERVGLRPNERATNGVRRCRRAPHGLQPPRAGCPLASPAGEAAPDAYCGSLSSMPLT